MFVRQLVATGVSLGAALAYAEVMPAGARAAGNYYTLTDHAETAPTATASAPPPPDQDLTPPTVGLTAGKVHGAKLPVTVTLSKPGTATVAAAAHGKTAGTASVNIPRAGTVHGSLKFTRSGRRAVAKAKSLTLTVHALDQAGNPASKSITVAL